MDAVEQRLRLYDLLTQELLSTENQIYQIVTVGTGAVAGILAAGFNQPNHVLRLLMFFTSYLILIPMIRLLKGNRARIWRIATYMRIYLEPELAGIKWQTHLALSRTQNWKSTFITGSQILVIELATVVVGVTTFITLCLVANWTIRSFVPGSHAFGVLAPVTAAALAIGNGILLKYESSTEKQTRRGGPIEQDYLRNWERLRNAT